MAASVDGLASLGYYSVETPFIQYFDRCYESGMHLCEIEDQLPSIEKYYEEMVKEKLHTNEAWLASLNNLFDNWRSYKINKMFR
jgi:hypothetical protein